MLVPFDSLPDSARIWVYQADQAFNPEQRGDIVTLITEFLQQWEAHGAPVKASFRISHDRFLIIAADERANPVTGCSTDAQVRFVQLLQNRIGVNFFDRSQVAVLEGDAVRLYPLNEVKQKKVDMDAETLTFNNLVRSKGQLSTEWMQPAGQSWLSRYL